MNLTSNQRQTLSSIAQKIKPIVQVGQNGVSDALLQKIDQSLECHELLKIKFLEFKDEKRDLTEQICEKCNATLVRIVGNVAILYRPSEKEENQKFSELLK